MESRGYCYHSAIRRYKTETLVRKWREGGGSPQQWRVIAYELSLRDPALALAEVGAVVAADPRKAKRKAMRLCLHHVADVETARALVGDDDFDPDALHLEPFAALLDDFLAALPGLDPAVAEARLTRLGFLAGAVPNPLADGPQGSPAYTSSGARYDRLILRFLRAAYEAPALTGVRPGLVEHLRRTYADEAYAFLFERWQAGEIGAVPVIAGVARLGIDRAREVLGEPGLTRLIEGFAAEIGGPAGPFEEEALHNGWLPRSAKDLPAPLAITVARAFLSTPRHEKHHEAAAEVLVDLGAEGRAIVIERAKGLPSPLVARAISGLSYDDARARLAGAGVDANHPALVDLPDAPPDMRRLPHALSLEDAEPDTATAHLASLAQDARHPDRGRAFDRLLALAGAADRPRVRRFAIHQLGELGDARATPVLVDALRDPGLADGSIMVITALGRVGDARALPVLSDPAVAERSPQAVRVAVGAIKSRRGR